MVENPYHSGASHYPVEEVEEYDPDMEYENQREKEREEKQ